MTVSTSKDLSSSSTGGSETAWESVFRDNCSDAEEEEELLNDEQEELLRDEQDEDSDEVDEEERVRSRMPVDMAGGRGRAGAGESAARRSNEARQWMARAKENEDAEAAKRLTEPGTKGRASNRWLDRL